MIKGVIALLLIFLLMGMGTATLDSEVLSNTDVFRFEKFLEIDQTDKNIGVVGSYECLDYSLDLIRNASAVGIDLELVNISPCLAIPTGHYLVAFPFADGTWLLVEPQNDRTYDLSKLRAMGITTIMLIPPETIERIDTEHIVFPSDTAMELSI